ncbi:unnamed protein product, partial [Prorocentrum cordatum]
MGVHCWSVHAHVRGLHVCMERVWSRVARGPGSGDPHEASEKTAGARAGPMALAAAGRSALTEPAGSASPEPSAGRPLSVLSCHGTLVSPLHPETHASFQFSRKRQAYGSAAPDAGNPHSMYAVSAVRTQPVAGGELGSEREARFTWYAAYAKSCEAKAHEAFRKGGTPRALGASGSFGHSQAHPSDDTSFAWQSYRGWTATSRHNHEARMREVWQQEARQQWRAQVSDLKWRPLEGEPCTPRLTAELEEKAAAAATKSAAEAEARAAGLLERAEAAAQSSSRTCERLLARAEAEAAAQARAQEEALAQATARAEARARAQKAPARAAEADAPARAAAEAEATARAEERQSAQEKAKAAARVQAEEQLGEALRQREVHGARAALAAVEVAGAGASELAAASAAVADLTRDTEPPALPASSAVGGGGIPVMPATTRSSWCAAARDASAGNYNNDLVHRM